MQQDTYIVVSLPSIQIAHNILIIVYLILYQTVIKCIKCSYSMVQYTRTLYF